MTAAYGDLEDQLAERMRFESLLLELSAHFVGLPSDSLDKEIEDAQRRICLALGLDRSTLFQVNESDAGIVTTHSWARHGLRPAPLVPVTNLFPWAVQRVRSGEIFQFTSIDDLPAEAAADKLNLPDFDLKSNLTFPLMVGGRFIGAIAFDTLEVEREWPEHLVGRLRLIAEMFGNALARRRTDQELRMSEERLELATEAAGAGLWSMDLDTGQVWVSAMTYKLFPFKPGETLTFESFLKVIRPEDRDEVRRAVQRALETDAPLMVEYRVDLPDGRSRWISARGHRRCKPDRLMGVSIDISARKHAEAESRRHLQALAHFNRVSTMGELTTSLAHELNQPLGAILRNAEAAELLLQSEVPDLDELRAIVTDIRHDDERAGNVIDRLRVLLKRQDIEMRPIGIARLVEEVLSLVRSDALDRQTRLETDIAADLPQVQGDPVHLQQVLINLIMNAMDAMPQDAANGDRRVVVSARPAGDGLIEVAVSDTGPGIPPGSINRVFEPFFTTKASGMGMGLAISRTIIEAHHGRIRAENNASGGATFAFTLAAAAAGSAE